MKSYTEKYWSYVLFTAAVARVLCDEKTYIFSKSFVFNTIKYDYDESFHMRDTGDTVIDDARLQDNYLNIDEHQMHLLKVNKFTEIGNT